jgi:hypothetical protein
MAAFMPNIGPAVSITVVRPRRTVLCAPATVSLADFERPTWPMYGESMA